LTTPDGKFTVRPVACFGQCALAPVVEVNHHICGHVTEHHYKVDAEGVVTWVNLIVATGHNNLAMRQSVHQVAKHYVDGHKLNEGMLNHVSAVVRAYDPCLSCSSTLLACRR
jgi:Thioredoxin-like [2Fe-2S] ferredoxin